MGRTRFVFLFIALSGCGYSIPVQPITESLINGEQLFGEKIAPIELKQNSLLEVSEAMREFVTRDIRSARLPSTRMRKLLAKLVDQGFYVNSYKAELTLTASETFETRLGNCLSFTALFVALAREAGLDAHFEQVGVEPMYDAIDGVLHRQSHIAAWVRNGAMNHGRMQPASVDFSYQDIEEKERSRLTDFQAEALYLNNIGLEFWFNGDDRMAFEHITAALRLFPEHADLWNNVAAIYSRRGLKGEAQILHAHALSLEPHNQAALAGWAKTYDVTSTDPLVQKIRNKVSRVRARNPYYHFAKAQSALKRDDYEEALEHVQRAIDAKANDPRFYLLKGSVLVFLDDTNEAQKSFERAAALEKKG